MKVAWAALLLFAACTPSFQSPSQVEDLRVLAVQTNPPEAQFDASHVDAVEVRILAVDPRQRAPAFNVSARACLPSDSRRCGAPPTIDVGPVSTDFQFQLPPSVVSDPILEGVSGIRVQMELTVDDGDPHGPVVADKIEVFSPTGTTPNHNPGIDSVLLSQSGQPAGTLRAGDTLKLVPGVAMGLRPVLTAGSRETYTTTDLNGNAVTLTEDPRWFFFGTLPLDFDRDTADEPLDGNAPSDGLTRVTALQAGSGTLWIVVRDGRGGETWLEIPWTT